MKREDYEFFRKNGYLELGQVLSDDEATRYAALFEREREMHGRFWRDTGIWQTIYGHALLTAPEFDGLIRHPKIIEPLQALMGGEVCFSEICLRHEVLGIAAGTPRVEFGGRGGVELSLRPGDAVLIPAGVSHYNLGASVDLLVIGAYPDGSEREDLCHDTEQDRAAALPRISSVSCPSMDPVLGEGGLAQAWT